MFWTSFRQYWWIFLVLGLILWFILSYQRSKRLAEQSRTQAASHNSGVQVGTRVILDSGMHGVVREVRENSYLIEIAPGVSVEFEKYGVIFTRSSDTSKKVGETPKAQLG